LSARIAALVLLAVYLAGCAQTRQVMLYQASDTESLLVWPDAQTREVPHYRYVGQLSGEANFKSQGGSGNAFVKALHWIAGLSERNPEPVVLQRPQSGVTGDDGRIYVTDVSRKAVFVFDEAAGKLSVWEKATAKLRFSSPIGVALGGNDEVLVTDSELHAVFRLDRDGTPVGSFGGDILMRPTGIARDPQRGLVFVADTQAHDLKVFDDAGRLVETIGQRGAAEGELNFPTHLAFANGTLYVADTMNSRIQAFDAAGKAKLEFGKRGLYVGNMVRPKGVAVDAEANIYVMESFHDHLLVFDRVGRFLLAIGGSGAGAGQFYLPAGVWIDKKDRVFVADMFNGRVVIFQFLGGH